MKKLYKIISLGAIALFASTVALGQYHSGDSTVIKAIAASNFGPGNALNWGTEPNPANWLGVRWDNSTPKRIIHLDMGDNRSQPGGNRNNNWLEMNQYDGVIILDTGQKSGKYAFMDGANVAVDMIGSLDFSALTELRSIDLRRNEKVKAINVSGLQKLEAFYMNRNDSCSAADFSGLTSLRIVNFKRSSGLTSLNVSGCTNLEKVMTAWGGSLQNIDITGCTALIHLNLKESLFSTIDLSGSTNLINVKLNSNTNLESIYGYKNLSKLIAFTFSGSGGSNVTGDFDLTDFDESRLYKFNCGYNLVNSVTGWDMVDSMEVLSVRENHLSLHNAVQIDNTPNYVNNKLHANLQLWPDQRTIIAPDSIDHTPEDSVDVNGTMVGTSFELFKVGVGTQGVQTTGMFNFVLADTGKYYIEMTNSGIKVTTDTIHVLSGGPVVVASIDNANFGSVGIGQTSTRTITVTNTGTTTLNVSNILMPTGYSISATTGAIAAGGSMDYTATFTPTAAQTYSGMVTVQSDGLKFIGNDEVGVTGMGIDLTGISEDVAAKLSFYPNPARDVLFIKDKTGNIEVLNLYNSNGMLVKTLKLTQATTQIDVRDLTTGVYFIRSVDGSVQQKIVKY